VRRREPQLSPQNRSWAPPNGDPAPAEMRRFAEGKSQLATSQEETKGASFEPTSFWRKLFAALTVVALAIPLFTLPADAASADRLTVRINAPKKGDTVNGFTNVSMTCNPRGQLGVPARREDSPYRTFSLAYARAKPRR